MEIVVGMGFGLPALAMLLLSIWTINALNLYSAGLSLAATFPGIRQGVIIVAGGLIGCIFALLGIIDSFIPFLVTLGLIIPPIAAIYVIDGFLHHDHADEANGYNPPALRVGAIDVSPGNLVIERKTVV